jgi:hypothetical protein
LIASPISTISPIGMAIAEATSATPAGNAGSLPASSTASLSDMRHFDKVCVCRIVANMKL